MKARRDFWLLAALVVTLTIGAVSWFLFRDRRGRFDARDISALEMIDIGGERAIKLSESGRHREAGVAFDQVACVYRLALVMKAPESSGSPNVYEFQALQEFTHSEDAAHYRETLRLRYPAWRPE